MMRVRPPVDSVKRFYARFRRRGARRLTPHVLGYCLEEAGGSLIRRPLMTVLALAVMTLSLLALGGIAFVGSNLNRIVATWGEAIQLNAYLKNDATEQELLALRSMLDADSHVESYRYIPREEALHRFGTTFEEMGILPSLSDGNPFPASLEIRMRAKDRNPESISALAGRLREMPGIEEVDADTQWLKKLSFSVRLFKWAGWTLATILLFASVFTIFNIIRLTLYHRQDDIEIMRLVGASEPMIRAPFIMEGVVQGILGGVVSLGILFIFYRLLVTALLASGFPIEVYGGVRFLSPGLGLMVLALGALAGLLGGSLAFVGHSEEGHETPLL